MPASARHETRALLRAHLSAATGYRHLTRRCPICHQLQRLAMEPAQLPAAVSGTQGATRTPRAPQPGDEGPPGA
ncbi:hypothetical protein GCM10018793_02210 [Streptomyces sulfonofaciens]|uniref:Uncharacterized protein n=1 Tax=Streptomyces sulfonofaciens TaxID=68272 RepID=A0A919FQ16_9ACTN|nr:DUF6274 family protein [Streptomyces sulfonofaciens]GHH69570.1 hypothetical protein GCM10018793_02210 [Streptomyces sulfonofaciens]